jgi:hypothetical protein
MKHQKETKTFRAAKWKGKCKNTKKKKLQITYFFRSGGCPDLLMVSKLRKEQQERVLCAADGNFCSPGTRGFARPSAVSAFFAGFVCNPNPNPKNKETLADTRYLAPPPFETWIVSFRI